MDCNCEKAPEFPTKAFIPGPIEIPVNFRAVIIPADQGDDRTNPPLNGAYRNVVLKYAANGHTYIYSSDGIPVALLVEVGDVEFNEILDRPKYDGQPMTSNTNIPDLSDEVSTLQGQIQALATDFSYKGSVTDYAHLPNDAAVGDVYTTTDTGIIYVWDGNAWVALNEYPSVFVGTDGTSTGEEGLVPAPTSSDAGKFLNANGNWETVGNVPTKTSDLTNDGADGDSTYVELDELATVATTGDYDDLLNKPTIPTVNDATLTIQQNGSSVATFTANSSFDVTANIAVPVIAMTSTDPGEGSPLAANNFIAVYDAN